MFKYLIFFLILHLQFSNIQSQTNTVYIKPLYDVALGYHDGYGTDNLNYHNVIQNAAFCIPGSNWGENRNRALLYFDLSFLTTANLISAKLNLYALGTYGTLPGHFGTNNATYLKRVTSPWSWNTVTWNTQPTFTTQNQVLLPQSTYATQDYLDIDVTDMILDMINISNNGMLLVLQNEVVSNGLLFCSLDYTDTTKHPLLEIVYSDCNMSLIIASNTPICTGDSLNLFTSSGSTYYWTGPNGFTSTQQNPVITNTTQAQAGYYTVQVVDANTCVGIDSTLVVIHPVITPDIQGNTLLCEGDTLVLFDQTGGGQYEWTGPNSFTSTQQEIIITDVTALNSGTYTVNLTNAYSCTSSDSIVVTVNPIPIATASANSPVCEGQNIQLSASGGSTYYWTGPNGFTSTQQNPFITNATLADSGFYIVLVSNPPCTDTAFVFVQVYPSPVVDAGINQTITYGESVDLSGSGGPPYSWHPAETLDDPTSPNPLAQPTVTTVYTLTVVNAYGCEASDNVLITVTPLYSEIFVPNVFSPHSSTHDNSMAYVYGPHIKEIKFFIYNRWGEKVFESFNQANGWDGYYKGQPSQAGVYYYYLEAELWDNKFITKKGNITLIR